MKKNILLLLFLFAVAEMAKGEIFTVTNTNDDWNPGSLRWTINQAMCCGSLPEPHVINFNIPGAGPHTILSTNGPYQLWGSQLIIDATSQPGYSGSPLIIIRGNGTEDAFILDGGTHTIKGLAFQNFTRHGIYVRGNSGNNIFQACYFGLGVNGSTIAGNSIGEYGIYISGAGTQTIGGAAASDRNTISNCLKGGILIQDHPNNVIRGNYIGTDATGTIGIGNGNGEHENHQGIDIFNSQNNNILDNVVSANVGAGINIRGNSNGQIIRGNKIGTDVTGNFPLGNKTAGIRIRNSSNHIIGGTDPSHRNIISANGSSTVPNVSGSWPYPPEQYDWYNMCGINCQNVSNTQVIGNYIGTNASGNSTTAVTPNDMGNFYAGIKFLAYSWDNDFTQNNTVGGNTDAHRNVIGGNGHRGFAASVDHPGHGVIFQSNWNDGNGPDRCTNNNVYKNYIGVGADGVSNIGNKQDGVSLYERVTTTNIGGNNLGNILGNNSFGVFIQNRCSNNLILGNYIGTNPTGTAPAGNTQGGVCIQWISENNYVGRANTGEGNLISGNGGAPGVAFRFGGGGGGGTGDDNFVYNNIIGLQFDGTSTMAGTNSVGVLIEGGSKGNIVGGTGALQRNIISGNTEHGVYITGATSFPNTIRGNYIGTDNTGAANRPNTLTGIQLNGVTATNADPTVIDQNVISGNTSFGIQLTTSTFTTITGNTIGLNQAQTAAMPNLPHGIYLHNASNNNTIGGTTTAARNVISGNQGHGILLEQNCNSNNIYGNYVGTNGAGTAAIPNTGDGIQFFTNCTGNNIGNTTAAHGNVISGNNIHGINFTDGCNNNFVRANIIGLDKDGINALGNAGNGFSCWNSTGNTVGGTGASRNVLSSNGGTSNRSGVSFSGGSHNTTITGNIIGLTADGLTARGNSDFGIWTENSNNTVITNNTVANNGFGTNNGSGIYLGSCSNATILGNTSGLNSAGTAHPNRYHGLMLENVNSATVGGTGAGERNIFSGNTASGIRMENSDNNIIRGNSIGTDAAGTANRGNGESGIMIVDGAGGSNGNKIGGITAAAEANLIAYNTGNGITIPTAGSFNNSINRNSIYCNTLRGIELSGLGNNNYAAPVFTNVTGNIVTGTAAANSYVEVFAITPSPCDDCSSDQTTNKLQGRTYIGTTQANGSGDFTFDMGSPLANTITATASSNNSGDYNTSEFSTCAPTCVQTPTNNPTGDNIVCEGSTATYTVTTVSNDPAATFFWAVSSGATIASQYGTGGNTIDVNFTSTSPITITVREDLTDCDGIPANLEVTVNPAPTISAAGPDQTVCATSATLAGNEPTTGTGTWTVQGGTGTATIVAPNAFDSQITDLTGGTTVIMRWTITNSPCTPSFNDVTITVSNTNISASAGSDESVCGTSASLNGNDPGTASGEWTVLGGTGTFSPDASVYNATVTDLSTGANIFVWSVVETGCSPVRDTVTITSVEDPSDADAGSDETVCDSQATLAATEPTSGTGAWTVQSGTGTVVNPSQYNATVNGLDPNDPVTLRWTVSNAPCTAKFEEITITSLAPPAANAGSDTPVCGADASLNANTPSAGSGEWSVITGSGTFADDTDPQTAVSGLSTGTNTFRWTITLSPCSPVSDDVVITSMAEPSAAIAGNDVSVCGTTLDNLSATAPTVGTGAWSVVSGAGTVSNPSSANSAVTGLALGNPLTLRWTVSNAPCTANEDEVTITSINFTASEAGTGGSLCGEYTFTLAANAPSGGSTGSWNIISGGGTFSSVNDHQAMVTNLTQGINIFEWEVENPGCAASTSQVIIAVHELPEVTATAGRDTICAGTPVDLLAGPATAGASYSYFWFVAGENTHFSTEQNVTVSPTEALAAYYVQVVDSNGCSDTSNVYIHTISNQVLNIPNLMTPNNDGYNDTFIIRDFSGAELMPGAYLEVFNKWGQRVYKHENYDNSWKATNISDGTYFYHLKSGCEETIYKGWVHILANQNN